ncbi:MAG: MerR family transcriptional regulator [Verrucomicrobiota bacterium]|nr:MerR family transcriptional regulator [Verrucomicrobiota bacterium]
MPKALLHPIQIAAARSGLSQHVIRVWERRYGAVKPKRDDFGRRLYSNKEIERLASLREVTQAGRSIGTIAQLSAKQLKNLIAKSRLAQSIGVSRVSAAVRAECLDAVKLLDAGALEEALQRGLVVFGQQGFLQTVVAPLAEEVGAFWRDGTMTAAHEHFFTASARVFLGRLNKEFAPGSGMPNLIVCTPTGQAHELGAFMVGVAATHLGWRVAYLGPGLPAAEIAGAALQHRAIAVALSIIYPEDDPNLPGELLSLRRYLSSDTHIIVGGRAAPAYRETLVRIGALVVGSLSECGEALDRLRSERAVVGPRT